MTETNFSRNFRKKAAISQMDIMLLADLLRGFDKDLRRVSLTLFGILRAAASAQENSRILYANYIVMGGGKGMKILRGLSQRLSGNYRIRERKIISAVRRSFSDAINRGIVPEGTWRSYIESVMLGLAKIERFGNLSMWMGGRIARIILGIKSPDILISHEALEKLFLDSFTRNDTLVFSDDIILPYPEKQDALLFFYLFQDILLSAIFESDYPAVTEFFENEGGYEFGDVKLNDGDVVLDCGANIGFFSAYAARQGCAVYAFEPSEHIRHKYMEKTAKLNPGITLCPYALSDRKETIQFFISHTNIGASRDVEMIIEGQKSRSHHFETVNAVALDDFVAENSLKKIDFIKADIEGAERKMLAGAKSTLREFAPKLSICTYHLPDDPQVLSRLILEAQPKYKIHFGKMKLYAHV